MSVLPAEATRGRAWLISATLLASLILLPQTIMAGDDKSDCRSDIPLAETALSKETVSVSRDTPSYLRFEKAVIQVHELADSSALVLRRDERHITLIWRDKSEEHTRTFVEVIFAKDRKVLLLEIRLRASVGPALYCFGSAEPQSQTDSGWVSLATQSSLFLSGPYCATTIRTGTRARSDLCAEDLETCEVQRKALETVKGMLVSKCEQGVPHDSIGVPNGWLGRLTRWRR